MRFNETDTASIAPVDNIIKKDIDEGYIHDDIIKDNISIKFYNDHHSDDSFQKCFDTEMLMSRIYSAYVKRAYNSRSKTGLEIYDMNITKEDSTTDEIAYALNVCCKHDHVWIFKGFAQHNTQVIFGTKTGKRTVVIYQHFPRLADDKEKPIVENFITDLFKSKSERDIINKFKKSKSEGDLDSVIKALCKKIKEYKGDADKTEVFEYLLKIANKVNA